MAERQPYDRLAKDGFIAERMSYYAALYPRLREVAYQHGYALALHGSLNKDLDLLAVPWVQGADSSDDLIKAITEAAGGFLTGPPYVLDRPHGRVTVSIHFGKNGGYIDLSVMPCEGKP